MGTMAPALLITPPDDGTNVPRRPREDDMKKWLSIAAILIVAGAAAAFWTRSGTDAGVTYRTVKVEKGDLEAVVSATGALSAVTTVEVGTQVSGLISKIMVDFNDTVKKGEVIAQLDTTLLQSSVQDAEASYERTQAELHQAERDFTRFQSLHEQGIAADADFNNAQYQLEVAKASMKSAEASLDRARRNLSFATIMAPVDGTVVERDVDVGQTVAASFSSPRLFTIANDLSEMQILASVDESDIGQIKEGQTVRFTVKAYPDERFNGTVKQVRLQSTTDQNVVSYTVVVNVKNPDGRLLPGMTATVEFLVASATDVLKVPNAALRFRPTEAMVAEMRARREQQAAVRDAQGDAPPTGTEGRPRVDGQGGHALGAGHGARPSNVTLLWFLDPDGKIDAAPVKTGITDGQATEITGRRIEPGLEVIAGMSQAAQSSTSNPFQPSQSGGRHGPPF